MKLMAKLIYLLMEALLKDVSADDLVKLDLQPGYTAIDYGCGSGRYLKPIADAVGPSGFVYGVDISQAAYELSTKKISRYNLNNAAAALAESYSSTLESNIADVVLALDMFHRVEDSQQFMTELNRLVKTTGYLIIDDGHKGFQSRQTTKEKIISSGLWNIAEEKPDYLKCQPVKH